MIRVVLLHGRIEISISAGGRYRHADSALLASMLHDGVPAPSTEAAERRGDRGAEASACVRHRHNLDHAPELPAVFRGITTSQDCHRLHIIRAKFRGEDRRTVIGHGQPVHHVLRLVLRTSRMQDAVGFEQPSGLRVDNVRQGTPGKRRGSALERFGAYAMNRSGLMRIHQRGVGRHGDLRLDGGQVHRHVVLRRKGRSNLDEPRDAGKAAAGDRHLVRAERQPPDGRHSCRIGLDALVELVRVADDFDRARQRKPAAISDRDAQFSRVALAELTERQEERDHPRCHQPHYCTGGVNSKARAS